MTSGFQLALKLHSGLDNFQRVREEYCARRRRSAYEEIHLVVRARAHEIEGRLLPALPACPLD